MAFWKPEASAPGVGTVSIDRESAASFDSLADTVAGNWVAAGDLPIATHRLEILYLLEKHRILIITGETGTGKTTQIPQYLHDAGWSSGQRIIACSQPRRLAATTIAQRVADERRVRLGREVGYMVRFDRATTQSTRIMFCTDESLFRETLNDPLLSRYSVVMVDDAHERSVYTDLLLGVLKKILKKRPDLRVIISSATLDSTAFMSYFNDDPKDAYMLTVQGRSYPVHIQYLKEPCSNFVIESLETIYSIHKREPAGDILVFLPDNETVSTLLSTINENQTKNLYAVPIVGQSSPKEQEEALTPSPPGARKVVLSTSVSESGITIPSISYVVDTGLIKLPTYNPSMRLTTLCTTHTSRASARQRAGRAGRTGVGKVYRLYTEDGYHAFPAHTVPEIQRTCLSGPLLQMKALGVENVVRFAYMSPPPVKMVAHGLEMLYALSGVDEFGSLTKPLGNHMAESPLPPMVSAMLLASEKYGCGEEAITIAAMLSVQNIFVCPEGFRKEAEYEKLKLSVEEGDHITYLNTHLSPKWCASHFLNYQALSRAHSLRSHYTAWLRSCGIGPSSTSDVNEIRKCLVSGWFANCAVRTANGGYTMVGGGSNRDFMMNIHPGSVLYKRSPTHIIFHELLETTKPYMRDCTIVEAAWLTDIAPHFYTLRK